MIFWDPHPLDSAGFRRLQRLNAILTDFFLMTFNCFFIYFKLLMTFLNDLMVEVDSLGFSKIFRDCRRFFHASN